MTTGSDSHTNPIQAKLSVEEFGINLTAAGLGVSELGTLDQLLADAWVRRITDAHARKWTRSGRLRPTRLCRRLLFCPDEVARLIAEAK
jgi:hypothetical protein